MSFKHYFPTFRTRWLFLERQLAELGHVRRILHVGCGEGDADRQIKEHCDALTACDLNEADVEHARALHGEAGIEYRVEDATAMTFEDASFDAIVCLEVIEHVGHPERLLSEIARVLVPSGRAILTCPSERFPATYDPINFALAPLRKHVPLGAYAFGHDWLVREEKLGEWLASAGLRTVHEEKLTGWMAAATECYWTGLAARMLKPNAANTGASKRRGGVIIGVRPSTHREPLGVGIVDALVAADATLTRRSKRSVGLGYVLQKA
jgi:2-polyprenyl-3-methyl-5-hydroxy-6-metoxy-1,4-benzoquinol methylase